MKIQTTWIWNGVTIKIPLCPSSFFNDDTLSLTVDWGDGTGSETITSFSSSDQVTDSNGNVIGNLLKHTYNNGKGHKVITITGGYDNKIAFMQTTKQDANGNAQDTKPSGTRWRIKKIYECNVGTQFYIHGQGDFRGFAKLQTLGQNIESLTSANPGTSIALSTASTATMFMDKTFFNCSILQYFGQFEPTNVTSLQYTLSKCLKLNKCKAINNWDMEKVTIATGACKDSVISVGLWKWFMESEGKDYAIEDMSGMFEGADFNKGINGWDLSTVKDTSNMFKGSNFNKPIWKWFKNDNVLEKTDGMFQDNDDFSKDLSTWDISNVTSKVNMFDGALQMSQAKVPETIVLPSPTPTPSSSAAVTPTPTPSVSASASTATPNFALSFDNGTYSASNETFTPDSSLGQVNGEDSYSVTVRPYQLLTLSAGTYTNGIQDTTTMKVQQSTSTAVEFIYSHSETSSFFISGDTVVVTVDSSNNVRLHTPASGNPTRQQLIDAFDNPYDYDDYYDGGSGNGTKTSVTALVELKDIEHSGTTASSTVQVSTNGSWTDEETFTVAFATQLSSSGMLSYYGGWALYQNYSGTLTLITNNSYPYIINGAYSNSISSSWGIEDGDQTVNDGYGGTTTTYFDPGGIESNYDSTFTEPTINT